MSQQSGGRSDKFGNEFECLWVVSLALRVLDGTATSLLWEPLGSSGNGIELRLTLPDAFVEVHQCKIENKYHGNWTVRALKDANVVVAIQTQLDRPDVDRFVFVSRDPCRIIDDLADRARRCNNDPMLFKKHSLSSKKHKDEFRMLCECWHLDGTVAKDVSHAIRYLQRLVTERGLWQPSERLRLEREARAFAKGEGKSILESIVGFMSESLGNEVSATSLRQHLRSRGFPPRDMLDDLSIAAGVERLKTVFQNSLSGVLAGNSLISRKEATDLLADVTDPEGPRLILLHGKSGYGKSGVLLEVTNKLTQASIPFLPIRLDSQRPESSDVYFRDVLGLSDHPVRCLLAASGNTTAVLIVDQLDAVRWTASHSESSWQICRELIELALARRNLRIIVACRSFDLEDDQRFRAWERELDVAQNSRKATKRMEVSVLNNDDVRDFVRTHGGAYEQLDPHQQELLRVPLCLYLWWTLRLENALPASFTSPADLMREFWISRRKKICAERGLAESEVSDCLNCVVDYLDREGRQDFPVVLVARHQNVVAAIQSLNVIHSAQSSRLKFAHQSFLDYLVAERVLSESIREGISPVEWIRKRDQSLFRREQLRQLLFLQRDQLPDEYVELLRQLMHDHNVRFHLRHLALGMLRSSDSPTDAESQLLFELLENDTWRRHGLKHVVLRHGTWLVRCQQAGLFQRWLESGNEGKIDEVIWMLRCAPVSHRYLVDETLRPFADSSDVTWAKRIDCTLSYDTSDDSDESYEWRVKRVLVGAIDVHSYSLHSAVKTCPIRVARLLAASFECRIALAEQSLSGEKKENPRLPDFDRDGWDELLTDIHLAGRDGWSHLLPVLIRSVKVTHQVRRKQLKNRKQSNPASLFFPLGGLWSLHRDLTRVNSKLRQFLTRIGRATISDSFHVIFRELSHLDLRRSRTLNELVAAIFSTAPVVNADDVLEWLLADTRRFQLRGSGSKLTSQPAARLISRFSSACSDIVFRKLEAALLAFYGPEEKYSVEIQLKSLKERGVLLGNHYGRAQFDLLSAMPRERLSNHARDRLTTWFGKFGDQKRLTLGNSLKGGFVSSSLPPERRHLVSDRVWLRLISTDWQSARERRRADKWLAERSHKMFAQDFGEQTKMNPSRFVRLANQMPLDSPNEYFESVLRALVEQRPPQNLPHELVVWEPAPFEEVQTLVLKLITLAEANEQLANAICWVVRSRASAPWNLLITDFIAEVAVNASGPCGEPCELGDTELNPWEGMRGVAVEALHRLIANHSGLAIRYLPELMKCIHDTHPSVRVAATGLCIAWARWNLDSAMDLFLIVCKHDDDRILNGIYLPEFLRFVWRKYAIFLEPLLYRMIDSQVDEVAELGAYRVTCGWIACGLYKELAERCQIGTVPMRKGVANALKDLSQVDEYREVALGLLPDFFNDSDENVSNQAAHVFYRNPELLALPEGPKLAVKLAQSQAFLRDPSDLIEPLHQFSGSLLPYVDVVTALVNSAAGPLAELITDFQTRHSRVSSSLPELLLRLYQEADGPQNKQIRHDCLDAWDRLLEAHVIGVETLNVIDK